MKRNYLLLPITLLLFTTLNGTTIYEDGEDGLADGWIVQQNGEPAFNVFSESKNSRVIKLEGKGGPWILGATSPDDELSWNNTTEKTISWKMLTGSRYTIYIPITTKNGTRYLFYNDLPKRILRHGFTGGILHGLGGYRHDEYKNVWRTYTRDLEADLKDSEPDNELISVNGFIYAGADVMIDDIVLYNPKVHIYSDGTNIRKWKVSDNDPKGATIKRIIDPQGEHVQGEVIETKGEELENAYRLFPSNWNNKKESIIQWKSRFYEPYSVSINVQTKLGDRELLYTNSNNYYPSGGITNNGKTIWHEMGGKSLIGENGWEQKTDFGAVNHFWQTVTRDLKQDLRDFEPNNELVSVNSFEVRGSGLIDDIEMLSRPIMIDSTKDIIYEDAEDKNSSRWHIYDNDPEGATISNIFDPQKSSRVIEFKGDGVSNGYEIGSRRGEGKWSNRVHKAISWSMNFSENFSIYIATQTTDGVRYFNYENRSDDRGKVGNYIRFGLGSNLTDGTWQTFRRNLQDDLHKFEPDNNLVEINGFLIRGSGKVDDIKTMLNFEKKVYEDAEDSKTDGWSIYTNSSGKATIENILDEDKNSRVIKLQGEGLSDGYIFRGDNNSSWNDKEHSNIEWSLNYSEPFTIYIETQTTNGKRLLVYTPIDEDRGQKGEYLLFGVGTNKIDGNWHKIERDLAKDIDSAESGNKLLSIDSFIIRGSGLIDDIATF